MIDLTKYVIDEGINLDGLSVEELTEIAAAIECDPVKASEALFPTRFERRLVGRRAMEGRGHEEVIEATKLLGRYASHKGHAMQDRAIGFIGRAIIVEAMCDELYNQLPEFAKW